MPKEIIYLVVLEIFDTIALVEKKFYFSNTRMVTSPVDFPDNIFFDPRILRACRIARTMFSPQRTFGPSQVGLGDLVLTNEDGGLDFFNDFSFDGRRLTQYRAERGSGGKFRQVLVANIAGEPVLTRRRFTIKVRDRQTLLDVFIQPNRYDGGNVLPDGLEGLPGDLGGKPKPLVFGRVININPPIVNTKKLIYQVSDGPIESLDAVYDKGVSLGRSLQSNNQETTPVATELLAVRFSNNTWMAMGASGVLLTSTDGGANWTSRTSEFGAEIVARGIYADSLTTFVIVGDANLLSTSDNTGVGWVARSSAFAALTFIRDAAFGTPFFVVVGDSNQIQTSTNGVDWTLRVSAFDPGDDILCVTFSESLALFVAGGVGGKIQTSPDGITWTEVESGFDSTISILGASFGNGLFCLVGESSGGTNIVVTTSPDGINWTSFQVIGFSFRDVQFSELLGRFVAAATSGERAHALLSSRDGNVWNFHDGGFSTSQIRGVGTNGEGEVLSVGEDGKIATANPPPTPYISETALLADANAPPAGSFNVFLEGGLFRLGSNPVGLVTADVTEGATAADRTAAQIFTRSLEQAGMSDIDWSDEDLLKLDANRPDELGYWTGLQDQFVSTVNNLIAQSIGGWWGADAVGQFRIQEVVAPGTAPVLLTFQDTDMVVDLNQVNSKDPGRGIPTFRSVIRYARNYAPTNDLAFGVTDERRAELNQQWREATKRDLSVKTAHLLAREQVYETLLVEEADAVAAAIRFQNLRGVVRRPYTFGVAYTEENELIDLGLIIEIIHPRFDLSEGKKFIVIEEDKDATKNIIKLTVWG